MAGFSVSSVYAQLTSFANLSNFWSLFDTAFGSSYDFATAASFRSQWQGGDFSWFPQIEVVSSDVLGTAKGAYGISTNRIYLSDRFVSAASQQSLEAVILEEFGHFVDAQVNATDTPGDEGELFSALVRGVSLSAAELSRIKTEDDRAVIVVDGQSIAVEQAATLVGKWDRLTMANAIAVVGNYAYVAGDNLEVIDISNPSSPIFVGTYEFTLTQDNNGYYAKDVQIVGNYAYVAGTGVGLQILDISNPTNPILKGTYNTPDLAWGINVVGNYAFVADRNSGLQIIDITNPSNPTLKGTYNTPGTAYAVQVLGNYAYVADNDSGLQIIDITNPSNPTLKGTYDTSGSAYDVKVVGNYAYVTYFQSGLQSFQSGLQIIDISNPAVPLLKATYQPGNYFIARKVKVSGNYAYVGGHVIDISNPLNPIKKGSYNDGDIEVSGNNLYNANYWNGLYIFDISNPAVPVKKGSYDVSIGGSVTVWVLNNYAYVGKNSSGLQIFDISNPSSPVLKSNYGSYNSNSESFTAKDVEIVGSYAYIASWDQGLKILDVSNPNNPISKTTLAIPGESYGKYYGTTALRVIGNYAYVTNIKSGLSIIDITNPTAPTIKGSYAGTAYDVQIIGNYAYIANGYSGLQIVNISNPTTPTLISNFLGSGDYRQRGIEVVGNYAYVASETEGLLIIDISNPSAPTLKGTYNTPGDATRVSVVGNYAYVADGMYGLKIINVSNPTNPTLAGNYNTSGSVVDVRVIGNYAYVADGDGGLKIIDVSDLTLPNQAPTNLSLSNTSIVENQAIETVVGTITSTAPDTGNTFTYSLVTGTGDTDNALFTLVGNQLQSYEIFDFETKNSYSIRVRSTDQDGLTFDKQLTIGITNINETPTNLNLSNNTIAENQAVGTAVGTLTTTDPDTGNTFTYSLVTGTGDTNNALFAILGNQLQSNGIFNFETKNSYSIRVKTIDQGGLTFEKQLTIRVTNINETPTDLTLSNTSIAENQAVGTNVGTLTSTDPDTVNTFTYSLVTGTGSTDNALFTITGNQLQSNGIFDFETKNSYRIRVKTTDQDGLSYEKELTVGITNVDEQRSLSLTPQQNIFINEGLDDTVTGTFANLQQNDNINGGLGIDTLILSGGTATDELNIDASDTTNQLDILGTTITNFERFDLSGFLGTVSILGINNSNNWLKTGSGNDDLTGGNGNDTLNGGSGVDILIGLKGNDSYVVDNTGDIIIENLNSGIDTVESSLTWTLKANLENLTLTGTTAINGTGNTGNNVITGNSAANILDGKTGADRLIGGLGNDTYTVDNVGDIVTETSTLATEIDTVNSSVTYTLSANVENLTLTGTANINGTGNTLANTLTGNTANNTLNGGNGNDILNGGAGIDTLIGGLGNDTYIVDNVGDIVTETSTIATEIDTVNSSVTYTLSANVENLTLTGTANINGTGNTLANSLTGNNGNNILTGNAGNDVLTGNGGSDILVGGTGNDTLNLGLNDRVSDLVRYASGDGTDTINQFIKGIDKLAFTGINFIDVNVSGSNTQLRLSDGIQSNANFGTGTLLATITGVTGFTVTELGLDGTNLDPSNAATFLFA